MGRYLPESRTLKCQQIRRAPNSYFNEIAWYYPSVGGNGENDSYVKFNIVLNVWDDGKLDRSAWVDQSVVGAPLGASSQQLAIYQHEISTDAAGQPLISNFDTGLFNLSDADQKIFIDEVWPDMKWGYYGAQSSATVNLSFAVSDFPSQTPTVFGPYPMTVGSTFISTRIRGRLMSISFSSAGLGTFWRIGGLRFRSAPDGRY